VNGDINENDGPPLKDWALKGSVAGGLIGTLLGFVQILAGEAILSNPWIDDSSFMFGLITIILSIASIYFAYRASRETSSDMDRKLGWLVGLMVPSVLCFFLVGILWFIPGLLLFGSALLLLKVMLHELNEAGVDHTTKVPRWKRRIVVVGALFLLVPVLFGGFVPRMELGSYTDGDDEYVIRPMDGVVHIEGGETVSSSALTGILIVHVILLMAGIISVIYGQIGARTVTIMVGLVTGISLLILFLMLPNILFIEGAQFEQFTPEHFSSISGGFYVAFFGTLMLIVSQFIGPRDEGSSANGK
jgi:hypothetical protein